MKPYPAYRPGSDRWFPSVPSHWIDTPVWTMFTRDSRRGHGNETLLSVYRDHGVIPKSSRDDNFNRPSEDLSNYQLVEPGNLVINKMKAWQGSLSISKVRGIVSPAYFVYRPHHRANERFLHHLLRSQPLVAAYIGVSKGVRINQWDLEPYAFSRMKLALPPVEEQAEIATYIDRETADIDTLIAEQQRLIEMLRERKKSVLDEALSSVPGDATRLKYLFSPSSEANHPAEEVLSVYREYGVIRKSSRDDNLNQTPQNLQRYLLVRPGDVVVNRMKAWQGSLGVSEYRGIVSGDYEVLRPHSPQLIPRYAHLLLRSPRLVAEYAVRSTGIRPSQWRLYWDQMGQIEVPVPPVEHQTAVTRRIDNETAKIDTLISETELFIELARERRGALITACVTGQVDVRTRVA